MRITDLNLIDVFTRYIDGLRESDFQSDSHNRYKVVCPFHKDTNPSLKLYDKTSERKGWDYHCFVCGAHGNVLDAVIGLGLAETHGDAEAKLRADFNMQLPLEVKIEPFCELKGLNLQFCQSQGWENTKTGFKIPYYGINGELLMEKVRVKYFGKDKYYTKHHTNDHATPHYGLQDLSTYTDDYIIFVEGETDRTTLAQSGFQVVGIPSNHGWQNGKYAHLYQRFNEHYVLHDNDEAGRALLNDIRASFPQTLHHMKAPNNAKDINDYHIYHCGSDIDTFKQEFNLDHALPGTVHVFLSQLEYRESMLSDVLHMRNVAGLIGNPVERDYFIGEANRITSVGKRAISAMLKDMENAIKAANAKYISTDLFEEKGCYMKTVFRNGAEITSPISNFILNPSHTIDTGEEKIRVVTLINNKGHISPLLHLDPEDFTHVQKFQTKCLGAGDFLFFGDATDIHAILNIIFASGTKTIYSPSRIGRLENGCWLFGNCGIDRDGTLILPDQDGIIELHGKSYLPRSISLDEEANGDLPTLPTVRWEPNAQADYLRTTADTILRSFGTYGTWLGLGWCVAGWFSDHLFKRHNFFPYLFITGKRNSGKTTFASQLKTAYGFSLNNTGMSIETPTIMGIMRSLSYNGSLPLQYDDYRNIPAVKRKDGFLLNVYNRQGRVRADANRKGVHNEVVNGFLLLSGEDIPSNSALLTRCVTVQVSGYEGERTQALLNEVNSLMETMPHLSLEWCIKSQMQEHRDALQAKVDEVAQLILARTNDHRYSLNQAFFAGAFLWAYGSVLTETQVSEFIDWLCHNAVGQKEEVEESHTMTGFMQDLSHMIEAGILRYGNEYMYNTDNDYLCLRLRNVYNAWTRYKREINQDDTLTQLVLRNYLKKEPYFVNNDWVEFCRSTGGRVKTVALDANVLGSYYDELMLNIRARLSLDDEF